MCWDCWDRAIEGAVSGEFAAIVTAPVHKGVINDGGVGIHRGTLNIWRSAPARRCLSCCLQRPGMRVALATTHLPLKDVSAAITVESLLAVATIVAADLRKWWGYRVATDRSVRVESATPVKADTSGMKRST